MKFKYALCTLGVCLFSLSPKALQAASDTSDPSGRSYTLLSRQAGVSQPRILLNGTWQFKYSPNSKWTTIQVPGEAAMQGYAIEHDKPFIYRKTITVPADYAGQRVLLRFDGVYSQARLSVNGQFVREHHGGFTRWETDVTRYVKTGEKNEIELEVTDRLDEISYASGYAHHPIGGILRDVTLFALPQTHLYNVGVETHLDTLYQDAVLRLSFQSVASKGAEVEFTLTDPQGKQVQLAQNRFPLTETEKEQVVQLPVTNPLKWDAEHPNLYTLTASVRQQQKEIGSFSRKVGFRDVKVVGNRMLVNGQPVKLRGACRHDIHPTLGRTTTAKLDSLDVVLFKQSNMNFVRTSHYPPSEAFLEYCDRYGLYVESESAVCFVDTYRQKNYAPGKTQSNPDYTNRYLGQCQEMVKSFRSHPSILFWSIGNESIYGTNFQLCWDWVKATDTTRPVIFSYPGAVDKKEKVYDILSMHYQNVEGNVSQFGMTTRGFQGHGIPALFDEWAHPACYTYSTLQTDPNIREFWGQSIDKMWSGLYEAPGGLGGAIWGYIDETFMLPEPKEGEPFWKEFAHTAKPADVQGKSVGYGEWGIVDVWRRLKPEFWSTKKAYSPVLLLDQEIGDFAPGQRLVLKVYNRFDHTNLNEIKVRSTYRGVSKDLTLGSVLAHQKGILMVPAEQWEEGEHLLIEFLTAKGELIDAFNPVLGREKIDYPTHLAKGELTVDERGDYVTVRGNGFEIPFHKQTGLIHQAKVGNQVLIERGPFLNLYINLNHLTGAEVRKAANRFTTTDSDWEKQSFSYRKLTDRVQVSLTGMYKGVTVDFQINITNDGQLEIDYLTDGAPNGFLRETGLSFHLPASIQQLDWKRKGYWNYYPKGDFAGNEGTTSLFSKRQSAYGEKPTQPWQDDTRNFFYWADAGANCKEPLTQMAKGMKENIYYYTLSTKGKESALSVVSQDASVACRINKQADEQLVLYTNNQWDYPEIAWGNYCKTLEAMPCYGKIKIRMK